MLGIGRFGRGFGCRGLAGVFFDAPIHLGGDRSDNHAPAALENALMNADSQRFRRFGLDVDDREFQAYGGGYGGLLVFGAEPRGLRELGGRRGAVYQDSGDWDELRLG